MVYVIDDTYSLYSRIAQLRRAFASLRDKHKSTTNARVAAIKHGFYSVLSDKGTRNPQSPEEIIGDPLRVRVSG